MFGSGAELPPDNQDMKALLYCGIYTVNEAEKTFRQRKNGKRGKLIRKF